MSFAPGKRTPKPWSNVLANPRFGTLITESGGGYTWFTNSREFKLTSWANDSTTDSPSEWLYLRDEVTGEVSHPLPQNVASQEKYAVAHAAGYSRFQTLQSGLELQTTMFVAADDPVKMIRIRIANHTSMRRDLSLTYFVEWVLGVNRDVSQLHVRSAYDEERNAIVARNPYIPEFADQLAFLSVIGGKSQFVLGRQAFLGRQQDPASPLSLSQFKLTQGEDAGGDPGAAAHCSFVLQAGEQSEVTFLLGAAATRQEMATILSKYTTPEHCQSALDEVRSQREAEASVISLRTPSLATNILMNHWLPNQVLACRLWGRSAFYQSGGAYGFRDQLQDVMAVVYWKTRSSSREHLLRAASHQYVEGDVQHWWHPPRGAAPAPASPMTTSGYCSYDFPLRQRHRRHTRYSNRKASFLTSSPLQASRARALRTAGRLRRRRHTLRALLTRLNRAFRYGKHGLPLMGCGDWNDGMNRVGEEGHGESVWQGWFLLVLLDEFLPLMRTKGDKDQADAFAAKATELRSNLESTAWDGHWYLRAFFDDGTRARLRTK